MEKRVGQALKVQSDMDVKREQLADVLRKVCVCMYVCICMYHTYVYVSMYLCMLV